jgi:hypothetical protein
MVINWAITVIQDSTAREKLADTRGSICWKHHPINGVRELKIYAMGNNHTHKGWLQSSLSTEKQQKEQTIYWNSLQSTEPHQRIIRSTFDSAGLLRALKIQDKAVSSVLLEINRCLIKDPVTKKSTP